ncbi:hypothetical protein MPTK1_5g11330 [Marchantia polymorpha subsp. ruderalis]|uniref:Uncharacterized protein n=2 Tax=Marchantia polymorpha TaxID=3197 RepID=A0AAF6BH86_MARPO|nr:hypothetical protein MARPO_0093s0056 [Marchantia polymorpha]BBN11370.1 hypothetical protein Mp_5g11330 [Marchantia polymorpha subsp. ruderalis]|eukprot:PTQ32982.1 hypothetical protein MARPO_0093s0056 [Marchantia polymorpha]
MHVGRKFGAGGMSSVGSRCGRRRRWRWMHDSNSKRRMALATGSAYFPLRRVDLNMKIFQL